ncbi:uncharacterized protein LOC135475479 [Liolophura sinensis]|uniref:uncharacterized protein LOC135475479 n=1 Tax=Liolophura sinensis TaxID=3198878 RepID=UPI003158DBE5
MMAFGEKCYRFVARDKTWDEAQLDCQGRGGNLVHVKNRETQDFLVNAVKNNLGWKVNGMWIGALDRTESNNYEWVNGDRQSKGEPMTWDNWAAGQPSCGKLCVEFCGQMRFDDEGKWHDYRCASSLYMYHYCCIYDMTPKATKPATIAITKTTEATTTITTLRTTNASTLETKPKAQTTRLSTSESPATESSQTRTTTRKNHYPPDRLAVSSSPNLEPGDNLITVSVPELVGGLVGAVVLILLLLLLLIFVIRRRKQAHKEEPTPKVHYTADPNRDENRHPIATAYINPTFVDHRPGDTERLPAMIHDEKEEEQNAEFSESQNPYEEILFDKEFQFEKPLTIPTNEYLHATFLARQDQGLVHGCRESRDPYSLNSLCRSRAREETSSTHPESELAQPFLGHLCKQFDGYVLPTQTTGHVSRISPGEYANNPGSEFPRQYHKTLDANGGFAQHHIDSVGTREQTSGNISPLESEFTQIHSTRLPNALSSPSLPSRAVPSTLSPTMDNPPLFSSGNDHWTPSRLEALSTDRCNHENVYLPVLETSV